MKRKQHQRDLGLTSRTIRRATTKNAILKAIAQDEDGVESVLETQEEMVTAMAASKLPLTTAMCGNTFYHALLFTGFWISS